MLLYHKALFSLFKQVGKAWHKRLDKDPNIIASNWIPGRAVAVKRLFVLIPLLFTEPRKKSLAFLNRQYNKFENKRLEVQCYILTMPSMAKKTYSSIKGQVEFLGLPVSLYCTNDQTKVFRYAQWVTSITSTRKQHHRLDSYLH